LGIVHGDIKLDNILVKLCQVEMEGGATQKVIREICLGDWGFSTTKTSTREDKCAYRGSMVTVAPEVMEKDVEAGPASDIYALGLSLFCLLEAVRLGRGDWLMRVVRQRKRC
ncbi:MAG: protein kinase family protein, partial [Chlamydiia bacterium]|nr:protein kinase family protein [Chlamydiia bacterium]